MGRSHSPWKLALKSIIGKSNYRQTFDTGLETKLVNQFKHTLIWTTAENKKLSAITIHKIFVGMESDERLDRFYNTSSNNEFIVRLLDLKTCQSDQLPPVSTLLDEISFQTELEQMTEEEGLSENGLIQAYHTEMENSSLGSNKN